METAIWVGVVLLVLVLVFQLYQWIEVNSAKRDMFLATRDTIYSESGRDRILHGGNTNPPPEALGRSKPPPPPAPPKKRRRR